MIELMIVVVIIGILAAIAVPNYNEYKMKSRRSDATTALMQIAAKQEQFFMDNRTYTDDLTDLGYVSTATDADNDGAADAADPLATDNNYYNIVAYTPTAYEFVLTAAPKGVQTEDTDCASISLDNEGVKASEDNGGNDSTSICW